MKVSMKYFKINFNGQLKKGKQGKVSEEALCSLPFSLASLLSLSSRHLSHLRSLKRTHRARVAAATSAFTHIPLCLRSAAVHFRHSPPPLHFVAFAVGTAERESRHPPAPPTRRSKTGASIATLPCRLASPPPHLAVPMKVCDG